jgi:hypothetical protein
VMASKQTPASSSDDRSPDSGGNNQPYQIQLPDLISKRSIPGRFSQFTSSPNLRVNASQSKDPKLRRSQSTTTIDLPVTTLLSPMHLPRMTLNDPDAVLWSKSMHESLRLSQFPISPHHPISKSSRSSLEVKVEVEDPKKKQPSDKSRVSTESSKAAISVPLSSVAHLQTHGQQPTSPHVSGIVHDSARKNAPLMRKTSTQEDRDEDDEDNSRHSVHLHSMRISHHLRSGSLLSWNNLADAPEMPLPSRLFRDRTPSNQSNVSQVHRSSQHPRQERQTSSSSFTSSRVPSKWGRVLPKDYDHQREMSSIYSNRPGSPSDRLSSSKINLPRNVTHLDSMKPTATDISQKRDSDSCPQTDNEETPRPAANRHDITSMQIAGRISAKNSLLDSPMSLAHNNTVMNAKKSKFREEFSPSPPRKKSSSSIIKFLNPKRNSLHSHSESNLKTENLGVDGPFDHLPSSPNRERRFSKSLMCLQVEQNAAGKEKLFANPVWEKALKAHQDERASMFLPNNRDLAYQASPFRERSRSVLKPKGSLNEELSPLEPLHASKRLSVPFSEAPTFSTSNLFSRSLLENPPPEEPAPDFVPIPSERRSALIYKEEDNLDPAHEVQVAFGRQIDDVATVGAWGKYPSYSRPVRSDSAGHTDNVQPRDFALENAVRFAMGDSLHSEEEIDPTARPESPPLINGRRRKKRVGSGRMAKSKSMTFGKQFLKNYSKIFRSQSTEFQRHGHGHRSSIATGGMLEYPELEVLPEVWRRGIIEERSRESSDESRDAGSGTGGSGKRIEKGKGKMKAEDSMATLRPENGSADNLSFALDGTITTGPTDRARVWSVYYEDCVPNFPQASSDRSNMPSAEAEESGLRDFGRMPSHHSLDLSRHSTTRHHSMPAPLGKHSRYGSHLSRMSIISHSSARPSFVSTGEGEEGGLDGVDERSMVSVRRSTMDLITMYREQEVMERERVLSLVRMDSMRTSSRESERILGVKAV